MKTVCVYCGSSKQTKPVYLQAAREFGKAASDHGLDLVYGAGSTGLMGVLADTMLDFGRSVTGIVPKVFSDAVLHQELTQLIRVETMHERKQKMFEMADALVALPGGIGTFEEIMEVFTWAQLAFHEKPFGLLNVEGYYDQLLAFFDHAVHEQFMKQVHLDMMIVESQPGVLLERLESYQPVNEEKWWLNADAVE